MPVSENPKQNKVDMIEILRYVCRILKGNMDIRGNTKIQDTNICINKVMKIILEYMIMDVRDSTKVQDTNICMR